MVGIIGKKIGMNQIFREDGESVPVSIVEAGPCVVTQVKTPEKDGYSAVQLGFMKKSDRRLNKPERGHFKAAKVDPYSWLYEFRDFLPEYSSVGKEIVVDIFKEGDRVKVRGISKGKGFQGVVKRYGFKGGPSTHGQSDRARSPGSIGASAYPSRVIKGMKMAGRMGGEITTTMNLQIVKIDRDNNILYIKGAIPGARNSVVTVRRMGN